MGYIYSLISKCFSWKNIFNISCLFGSRCLSRSGKPVWINCLKLQIHLRATTCGNPYSIVHGKTLTSIKVEIFFINPFFNSNPKIVFALLYFLDNPFMPWIVMKSPDTFWSGHHIQIIQIISMRSPDRMIPPRYHHHIMIMNRHCFVQTSIISVNTLERNPCGGLIRW